MGKREGIRGALFSKLQLGSHFFPPYWIGKNDEEATAQAKQDTENLTKKYDEVSI
jgi:hypothetical protein